MWLFPAAKRRRADTAGEPLLVEVFVRDRLFVMEIDKIKARGGRLARILSREPEGRSTLQCSFDREPDIFGDVIGWYGTGAIRQTPGRCLVDCVREWDYWGVALVAFPDCANLLPLAWRDYHVGAGRLAEEICAAFRHQIGEGSTNPYREEFHLLCPPRPPKAAQHAEATDALRLHGGSYIEDLNALLAPLSEAHVNVWRDDVEALMHPCVLAALRVQLARRGIVSSIRVVPPGGKSIGGAGEKPGHSVLFWLVFLFMLSSPHLSTCQERRAQRARTSAAKQPKTNARRECLRCHDGGWRSATN